VAVVPPVPSEAQISVGGQAGAVVATIAQTWQVVPRAQSASVVHVD
jgi:hypothetical protein